MYVCFLLHPNSLSYWDNLYFRCFFFRDLRNLDISLTEPFVEREIGCNFYVHFDKGLSLSHNYWKNIDKSTQLYRNMNHSYRFIPLRDPLLKQVETIFRLMKENIISKIKKTKWMSDGETKAESIEKIDKLHGSLLGSNIFFNYTFLQQRYTGVCV